MKIQTILFLLLCGSMLSAQPLFVSTITPPFDASGGVKIGPDGHLYIGNFGQGLSNANGTQVWRLNLETFELEEFASGLMGASGNAFDSQGNLFQSNIAASRISKITPDGNVSTFVTEGISAPVGIAIDEQDNLYVCNCGGNFAHTIRKVTPEGVSTQFAGGDLFKCPNGITIDQAGNLYVSNFNDSRIIKITPDGTASEYAFIPGNNNGHLTYFEPFNALFVNSHGSSRIYKIDLEDGVVDLIAGTGARGNADGLGMQSTFSRPNGIALSTTGDTLFINSSIPVQDNPSTGSFPLNPSVIRMVRGVSSLFNIVDSEEHTVRWDAGISPNPTVKDLLLEIELPNSKQIEVQVYSAMGMVVYEKKLGLMPQGKSERELVLPVLDSGAYFLFIQGEQMERVIPFQLVR